MGLGIYMIESMDVHATFYEQQGFRAGLCIFDVFEMVGTVESLVDLHLNRSEPLLKVCEYESVFTV